jgi:hypothetical protein
MPFWTHMSRFLFACSDCLRSSRVRGDVPVLAPIDVLGGSESAHQIFMNVDS